MGGAKNLWKEASTVLLLRKSRSALQHASKYKFNCKILMLERSSKSKFMPSAYVFPGGHVSNTDFASEWNDRLTLVYGASSGNDYAIPAVNFNENRSPMLQSQKQSFIRNNVGFRICGIRETFEESGILLQKSIHDTSKPLECHISSAWRKAVNKDDSKFLSMCKELNIVPDIWSLYEWSNWLTPNHLKSLHGDRRYDTMFYISFLSETVDVDHDDAEIVAAKWYHPVDLLRDHYAEKLWLAPPQIYELNRLFNHGYGDFDTLRNFAIEREAQNCERYLPVRIKCSDGGIGVLPGDDLYPDDVDVYGVRPGLELPCTIEESLKQIKNINRFELRDLYDCRIFCNIRLNCGQLSPVLPDLTK